MDSFDYSDDTLDPTQDSTSLIWNILTVVVVLMTVCLCAGFGLMLINPQVSYNPFPPATLPPAAEIPTSTPTPKSVLPPTWTPAPTEIATQTPVPTSTSVPANTPLGTEITPEVSPTGESPAETPGEGQPSETPVLMTPSPTASEGMPFVLHPGDPVAIDNIGHPELACNWMGVAGRAFDLSGAPIEQGLFVQLGGTLGDETVEMLGMLGMVETYGTGSYEFVLGDTPISSTQSLWVQLFDQAMLPLSEQIYFDTFAECDQNLILINFNQVR